MEPYHVAEENQYIHRIAAPDLNPLSSGCGLLTALRPVQRIKNYLRALDYNHYWDRADRAALKATAREYLRGAEKAEA